MVSPPWDSSRAFGGRKRATTLIAELLLVMGEAGVGDLMFSRWESPRGGRDLTRWGVDQ